MLAAVLHGAGDLRVEARPEPGLDRGECRVEVACGGICGSDLSYFGKGRVGDYAVAEPLVLGHEIAGTVIERGPGDSGPPPGTRVAIDPSRACRRCDMCRAGRGNLCRDMRFLGSAARTPHVQGGFSRTLVVASHQCVPIPEGMTFAVAACAEPLAVALHAARRAGDLLGRSVLVSGAGPIGLLCCAAARLAGAASVTAADLAALPLRAALAMGADRTAVVGEEQDGLAGLAAGCGGFDVAFEASGAAASLASLPALLRPGGRIVQVGMMPPSPSPVPVNLLMAREIDLVGSFRFDAEFAMAVAALATGRVEVGPMLGAPLPLAAVADAFRLAADKGRAIKVHIDFD